MNASELFTKGITFYPDPKTSGTETPPMMFAKTGTIVNIITG